MFQPQTILSAGRAMGLRTENSRAIATSKEAAVGLIHDLGNLIQIASSAVNIMARDPSVQTADLECAIDGAKTSLERAGALVRQTIGMASERVAEQVSVVVCLAEIQKLLQLTWADHIRLDIQSDPHLPSVKCDPLALQSAVLNLVVNAREAMPNGGVISIRAEAVTLDFDRCVELRVVDSGVGMKPETIASAFEPFFTTKSDGLGGVGLPMVEHFAHDAGGRVLIESEYGVGTTVKLRLPAYR